MQELESQFSKTSIDKNESDTKLKGNNCIAIKIWLPKVNNKPTSAFKISLKAATGNLSVNLGHISIQTPNAYSIMYPDQKGNTTHIFKLYKNPDKITQSDEFSENKLADITVRLYSLNWKLIEQAFDKVKQTNGGYVFVDKEKITEKEGQNYCTLAYHLLQAGGIDELDAKETSLMKVIRNPEDLIKYIRHIKDYELKKYPETSAFERMENEYIPIQTSKKS